MKKQRQSWPLRIRQHAQLTNPDTVSQSFKANFKEPSVPFQLSSLFHAPEREKETGINKQINKKAMKTLIQTDHCNHHDDYFPHTPYLKDIHTVTDGRHMDKAPGVSVCICVYLLDIGRNRLPDFMTLILWWSAFTACVLLPMVGHTVAILGSCILSSILLIHPQVSRQGAVCMCVFVCA